MSYHDDRDRDRGRQRYRRLYVGNLNRYVRERDLDRMFSKMGRIRELELMSKYAFIEYEDPRDAEDAIREFDGVRLEGDRIIVEYAKSRRGRYDGPSRGRDRNYTERCYNCGEMGHISRECHLPKGSGERAMRFEENRCFECGERDHRARDCPNKASNGRRRASRSRSPPPRRERSASPRSRSPAKHSRRYSGEREDRSRYGGDDRYEEGYR